MVKKEVGNAFLPFLFPSLNSPSLTPPPSRAATPENQLSGLGSAVSPPWRVRCEVPAANAFLVYFELENRTWLQRFWLFILAWNSCISKKCRNGVMAFNKAAERRSGVFRFNLSTERNG